MDVYFKSPDFRYHSVLRQLRETQKCVTEDPLEDALATLLLGEHGVPKEVLQAYLAYRNDYKKEVIEAFFLAGGGADDLAEIFSIDPKISGVYAHLFFDRGVFSDKLDMQTYARTYPDTKNDGYGKALKCDALDLGLEYLKASFGKATYCVPEVTALRENITQAYLLSKVSMRHGLDTQKAKESRQWAAVMIKALETLPTIEEYAGTEKDSLLIHLQHIDQTNTQNIDPADIAFPTSDDD